MNGIPDVSVVLPCLNEEGSVGECVKLAKQALEEAGLSCEVIVCDNGSTDGSADVAEAAGARVVVESRRGYGAAVSKAVENSRGRVVLSSDSDGTYPLEDAPKLARAALDEEAIILGSRFQGTIAPGAMPALHRLVGSPATRLLMRVLLGVRSSDPHSGMRAMRRTVFEAVKPRSMNWEFTVEMLVNAARRGVAVREIPVDYRIRVGTSKLRALPEGWGFFRFMILHSPKYLFVVPGLLAMVLGVALLGLLVAGERTIGPVNLGVNSLIVGALGTIVGFQIAALGVCARAYMSRRDAEAWPAGYFRWFTLERGITVGIVALAAGVVLVALIGARWVTSDLAPLSRFDHGLAVVGLTVAVVGMQTIFTSFFMSLMGQE